jgi:hypothetical protein
MKVGDLVRSVDNTCEDGHWCGCWFCSNNSSRLGIIIKKLSPRRDPLGTIAPTAAAKFDGYWSVLFDAGVWRLYGLEMEVVS